MLQLQVLPGTQSAVSAIVVPVVLLAVGAHLLQPGSLRADRLEHVEFTVRVEDGEEYIVGRLEREKRVGTVERIDPHTYRFSADVYDSGEMLPWIRTFICRIEKMNFSNRTVENRFKEDLREMYRIYGIDGEVEE